MKYLFLETVLLPPHLETAGEYALTNLLNGNDVSFCYLGFDLPWHEWRVPKFFNIIGYGLERRLMRFCSFLKEQGVTIHPSSVITNEQQNKQIALNWANSFRGDLESLKRYDFEGVALGLGVASSIISYAKDSRVNIKKYDSKLRDLLMSSAMVYLRSLQIIDLCEPDVVVTFNGRFAICHPIVSAASKRGVQIQRHERGHDLNHYEIFNSSVHDFAARTQSVRDLWSECSSDCIALAEKFYQQRRIGVDQSWYSFTKHQSEGCYPSRIANRKRFVYFSSSDDEFAAIIDENVSGPFEDQYQAVEYLAFWAHSRDDIEFVLRIHPHLASKSYEENQRWLNFERLGAVVIPADDKVDSYGLLTSADIVATYGSTIGIEAVYWGIPSVLLGPAIYRGLGAVLEPLTIDELEDVLKDFVNGNVAVCREKSLPYGYYQAIFGRPYKYYHPLSFSSGRFMGRSFSWYPIFASKYWNLIRNFLRN